MNPLVRLPPLDIQKTLEFPIPIAMFDRYAKRNNTFRKGVWQLMLELKKFLFLVASFQREDQGRRFSPPPALDPLWHHFISDDTELYRDFCSDCFSLFIHHRAGATYPRHELTRRAAKLGIVLNPSVWSELQTDERDPECG